MSDPFIKGMDELEASTRTRLELLTALVDASPYALIVTDDAGEIVFSNLQAEILFGYSRDELTGQSVDILVPTEFQAAHAMHRAKYMGNPQTREFDTPAGLKLSGRRKNGDVIDLGIRLAPVRLRSGVFAATTIMRR